MAINFTNLFIRHTHSYTADITRLDYVHVGVCACTVAGFLLD